jgi:hypothetical protein
MARKSLSRATAEALGPIVVPLVTKVALPIAIESLRRGGRFDTEKFFEEAKESLSKGARKSRPELDELKDQITERGSEIYEEIRKQGAEVLESLAERGSELAEDWMERVRPRRRRFRWGKVLVVLAVLGVGIAVLNRD